MGKGLVRIGIWTAHLLARSLGGEHPGDAGAFGITATLPSGNLGLETFALGDAAVQALAAQHADLDLHHIELN